MITRVMLGVAKDSHLYKDSAVIYGNFALIWIWLWLWLWLWLDFDSIWVDFGLDFGPL